MYRRCYRFDDLLPTVIPSHEETSMVERNMGDESAGAMAYTAEENEVTAQVGCIPPMARNQFSNTPTGSNHQMTGRQYSNQPMGSMPQMTGRRYSTAPVGRTPQMAGRRQQNPPPIASPQGENPPFNHPASKVVLEEPPPFEPDYDSVPPDEDIKSSLSSFSDSATASLKGIFEKLRSQIMRDGKVLGIVETDDLVIILVLVILLAEESDDYILMLALAALLFIK